MCANIPMSIFFGVCFSTQLRAAARGCTSAQGQTHRPRLQASSSWGRPSSIRWASRASRPHCPVSSECTALSAGDEPSHADLGHRAQPLRVEGALSYTRGKGVASRGRQAALPGSRRSAVWRAAFGVWRRCGVQAVVLQVTYQQLNCWHTMTVLALYHTVRATTARQPPAAAASARRAASSALGSDTADGGSCCVGLQVNEGASMASFETHEISLLGIKLRFVTAMHLVRAPACSGGADSQCQRSRAKQSV